MGGNLISLTIGGWCYEQVGSYEWFNFISSRRITLAQVGMPDVEGYSGTAGEDGAGILNDAFAD